MKLGIYGGSFDPVHLGHILVARAAIEEIGLQKLFFVPAARSPFKPENQPAPDELRLRLLRLALAGMHDCEIDRQEIDRGGTSYTIDTLRHFARTFPGADLFFLIGADNAAALAQWREAAEIARLAVFVAVPRPGAAGAVFPPMFQGRNLKGFPISISSSEIRSRLQAGLTIKHLVPAPVAEAILGEKMYL
jgi:nicotinate-nucleotide adenylyltransferase